MTTLPTQVVPAAKGTHTLVLPDTSKPDPLLGQVFDNYCLESLIGNGGMGKVYKAWHHLLKVPRAIKVMNPTLLEQAAMATQRDSDGRGDGAVAIVIGRFVQEAVSASRVNHPHVVTIHECKQRPDGTYYIVMEYLEGQDLLALLRANRVHDGRLLTLFFQAAWAFHVMHLEKIVHRDIKPSNLFVTTGPHGGDHLKILDFGVAKMVASERATNVMTSATAVVGTVTYMAPEQVNTPDSIDGRADIYALAAVVYEALTRVAPFYGKTFLATLDAKRNPPLSVRAFREDISTEWDRVLSKALAWNADDRYPSMRAFAEAVAEIIPDGPDILARHWPDASRSAALDPPLNPAAALPRPITQQHPTVTATSNPSISMVGGEIHVDAIAPAKPRRRALKLTSIAVGVSAAAALTIGFTARSMTSNAPVSRPAIQPIAAPVSPPPAPPAPPVVVELPPTPTAAVIVEPVDDLALAAEEARINDLIDKQEAEEAARERRRKRREEKRSERRKHVAPVRSSDKVEFDPDSVL